ncbi:MAG: DUF177 domain-containing protein [Chlamydiae bacterium]|nr:DUF177 domain-containing protein [Chlamydiota bacterium]
MELKIFIDRLKEGSIEKFSHEISPAVLSIEEENLSFPTPIKLQGEAYLAADHLIIKIQIHAKAKIPCSICNEPTEVDINIPNFYHTEPVEDISGSIFDYTEIVREDILLEIPQFCECNGKCPERETVKKYLKNSEKKEKASVSTPMHFPFAEL